MAHSAETLPEGRNKSAEEETDGRRRSGRQVTVGLVDRIPLRRETLQDLLRGNDTGLDVIAARNASQLLAKEAEQRTRLDIIVLRVDRDRLSGPWAAECLERIRKQLVQIPVMLLSDERDPHDIAATLASSVSGYITSTSGAELVESAMHLAANGWILLSLGFAPHLDDKPSQPVAPPAADELAAMANLTRREREVLEVLKDGTQNKVIANELHLQESTVKAHVREIMRKLNVRNRTEAAVLYNRFLGMGQGSGA